MIRDIKTLLSPCGQHHLSAQGNRLYLNEFDKVLPFHNSEHNKQLAPVKCNNQAWHILLDGSPAYEERFDETFGFYCGLSAVIKTGKWFHIHSDGSPAYPESYSFAGNFQQDVSVVCDDKNQYFHIDKTGKPLYQSVWRYCGDFRECSAVVQSDKGLNTHILSNGKFLHEQWFLDLDVYHKGYARAKDQEGWHHIDGLGREVYSARYANIEPFYNGCARVEAHCGSILIIDEIGNVIRNIKSPNKNLFAELSGDMVGYWKTFSIAAAVELQVCDHLPETSKNLASKTFSDQEKLTRLLKALGELGIVNLSNNTWYLLPKGKYLQRNHELSLSSAALEYKNDLLQRWYQLTATMKGKEVIQDIFTAVDSSDNRRAGHHKMLRSYALHDYKKIVDFLPIKNDDTIFDAAGGDGTLCELIKDRFPNNLVALGDMPNLISELPKRAFTSLPFDLFQEWPIKADKIILARVLHDWNNEQATTILCNAKAALKDGGEILVLEMLLQDNTFSGSLCDLHLLASTGGQERSLKEFDKLFAKAKLSLRSTIDTNSLVTIMQVSK